MKWFCKRKKEEKENELEQKDFPFSEDLLEIKQKEIQSLEKEVVYWKEKAMNFKRFHQ